MNATKANNLPNSESYVEPDSSVVQVTDLFTVKYKQKEIENTGSLQAGPCNPSWKKSYPLIPHGAEKRALKSFQLFENNCPCIQLQ